MLNKFFFLLLFICLFLITNVLASQGTLGTFKKDTCINLIQTCSDCTWNNITSVTYPNSSIALGNVPMVKSGTEYTYPFCLTETGVYTVNGVGNPAGTTTIWLYDLEVNGLGQSLTTSQSILYVLLFVVSLIFFVIALTFGITIPYKNRTDEVTGYVISLDNAKYFKLLCLSISYLMIMLMAYFGYIISYSYLGLEFIGKLFNVAWVVLTWLIIPFFVLGTYILIANLIRDAKIGEALERGWKIDG